MDTTIPYKTLFKVITLRRRNFVMTSQDMSSVSLAHDTGTRAERLSTWTTFPGKKPILHHARSTLHVCNVDSCPSSRTLRFFIWVAHLLALVRFIYDSFRVRAQSLNQLATYGGI